MCSARASRTLVAGLAALALGACGSSAMSAEELIEALNERGAELALGERIAAREDGVSVHSVSLTGPATDPAADHEAADHDAGGSLLVAAGEDEAAGEHRRCDAAASLVCFRAANGVLMFEDAVAAEHLARIELAVRGLADA